MKKKVFIFFSSFHVIFGIHAPCLICILIPKKNHESNKYRILKQSGEKNPIHKTGIQESYSNNTHTSYKKNTNLFRFWIKSILYVTFSNNSKMSDNLDSTRAQHVVFWIGKCLTWSNNNGLSSVDTKWINILHVTNLQGDNDGLVKNLTLYLSKVANPARACTGFHSMKIYKVLLLPWSITGYAPHSMRNFAPKIMLSMHSTEVLSFLSSM